ncbi:NAD(P)H-dependent oxidoreductase [Vagococcus elongatus]|uniref:Flavodoxin-like fold domain-containing protein n=1 Tax=Vagococcus elongatus TaxID=180344 RepID=A0A430AMV3_9ENTE|nr:NAD(P)H-dependent oxidoreductase [Vagococcus elongatus]RSU09448.1 hypothetical protein CBF29_11405 [Vagococcus elongatus]
MKTLIIISHPDIAGSHSQQFLLEGITRQKNITVHHLETLYPDGKINIEEERLLVEQHQRIIFQFPLYWYSSPAMLKHWQDEVLEEDLFDRWKGKDFGLVVLAGIHEREFRAGGRERVTMDELMRPFQTVANKFGWHYLPVLSIHQFNYQTEEERKALLVRYQQLLTLPNESLNERTDWFVRHLRKLSEEKTDSVQKQRLAHLVDLLLANQEEIEDLKTTLDELD